MPDFASVVLDVDSTLCGVEGIDFLASRRGPEVGAEIAALTNGAMSGEIPLQSVYGKRLTIIRPTHADIAALTEAYRASVARGAAETIAALRRAAVRLALVSGGIRQAIEPVARELGFAEGDLQAVSLTFDANGNYAGFDAHSTLTTQRGKCDIVGKLIADGKLPRPVLAAGDGSTDIPMAEAADTFAAYTGFARRDAVVKAAAFELRSFEELRKRVIPL